MSTESNLSVCFENSPLGHRYVIHLKSKDEVCLHALTLLQSDSLPCFLPAELNENEDILSIDLAGCIPLSELKGKDKSYVKQHHRQLLSSFLYSLIQSVDHAMDPGGICFLEDQLFYDRKKQKLVAVYLPLNSRLNSAPFLSSIDESGLDDLLHYAYEQNWISTKAMDHLYECFRNDDDFSALHYISRGLWDDSRTLFSRLRYLLICFAILLVSDISLSPKVKSHFSGSILAVLPDLLFLSGTVFLVILLINRIRNDSKDKKLFAEKKNRRRKNRNTRILFPSSDKAEHNEDHSFEFHQDPVQLIRIDNRTSNSVPATRLTIWTNTCTVGSDSDCCALSIDHSSLALKHAVFGHDEYGFYVEALQNSKGTFRNRHRIKPEERSYLKEGDLVGLGDLEFEVHFIHDQDTGQRS